MQLPLFFLDQEKAFFHRGAEQGPHIFITDDATATIKALENVWPSAIHILCQWHCLQAVWRYLGNGRNQIKKEDKPILMRLFRKMVYAESRARYEEFYQELISDKTAKKNILNT